MLHPKKVKMMVPSPEWFTIGKTYCELVRSLMVSGMFRNVLEIGSAQGYSTHCFASAMEEGGFDFTACDVSFSDSVLALARKFPFRLKQKRSAEVISCDYDFIFVDGNHDIATVGEEVSLLLDCGTDTILAHDTFLQGPNFAGPVLLRKVFSSHRDIYLQKELNVFF